MIFGIIGGILVLIVIWFIVIYNTLTILQVVVNDGVFRWIRVKKIINH